MKFPGIIILAIISCTVFYSCKKWSDPTTPTDPRLNERKYCNDPEAVNYNWNFPGKPDNSVCIYPSDLFKGTYTFTDSIYNDQQLFDSAGSQTLYTLQFIPVDKSRFRVVGFCANTDSLKFTAERSTYQANADTTIFLNDTTKVYGQFFCRNLDTLSGNIVKSRSDSTSITIQFQVVSDTGINYHRGTAIKQ